MTSAQAEALGSSESTSDVIVQVCPCGMVLFDGHGAITLANPAFERMFGYAAGELGGASIDALIRIAPQKRPTVRARSFLDYVKRAEPSRLSAAVEFCGVDKQGGEVAIEVRVAPLSDGSDRTLALVADVAERKQLERDIKQRIRELEQSNSDLEQFASIASHDLREPLRMVVSYTQLLAERYRGQLDEKADKFINYAVQGATRMQRLIDDLLAYARLENPGRPSLPTPLNDVLRDTLSDMRVLIQDNGARIEYGQLPVVLADPVQLAQLLQNLIHNAIKFRREDPPWIEISAEPEGGMWRISFRDNGIGIEKRFQDRIFQMFQRLHERGKYEGNGIGLATARKIVERHGGRIGLTSTPGQGSTFFFTLPAAPTGPVLPNGS